MTDLSRFRAKAPTRPASPKLIDVLDTRVIKLSGILMAVDQSLGNTGVVVLHCHPSWGVTITETHMITTEAMDKGTLDTLLRGGVVYRMMCALIDSHNPDWVVHERPPTSFPGAKMKRPESSLVAAMAVRCAALAYDKPVILQDNVHVKNVLTGNPKAEKSDVRDAVIRLCPVIETLKPKNEHTFDAAGLGIVQAMEGIA